jgi:hypothetical protein
MGQTGEKNSATSADSVSNRLLYICYILVLTGLMVLEKAKEASLVHRLAAAVDLELAVDAVTMLSNSSRRYE